MASAHVTSPTVQKSRREVRKLRLTKDRERELKEQRKKEQDMNVARKRKEKEEHKARCLAGMGVVGEDEDKEDEEDVEWFRKEVGEDPDPGVLLFIDSRMMIYIYLVCYY